MVYLSDTARVVLAAAAQRDDLSVLPFPGTVKAKGGAADKVLAGLARRGLIREVQTEPRRIVITSEGMAAIGVEAEDGEAASAPPETTRTRTPRAGTKQALVIDLLKRPEGATVEQIAAAIGWQHHTIRGAISGALKKKLGLNVQATRTREVGPNKTGAKGSMAVYRIVY